MTKSDSGSKIALKCEFCRRAGSYFSIDYGRDELPPDEIRKFKILLDKGFYRSVLQCRKCKTIFSRVRQIDNEIVYGSDIDEFTEISEARAGEMIRFEKEQKKLFASEIRRRLVTLARNLSKPEKEIINIFTLYMKDSLSIYELKEKAMEPLKSNLLEHLDFLVDRGILKRVANGVITNYLVNGNR